ncbi:hypothetical protein AVEN_134657-1 [Araneus ventricosus]|uniref:Endonuclease/exonuclease/phosphatase domain-containing protein n=1 Tax=Araneus ventricosus TaxID=182803 RepID=A0A4Y2F2R5_ARAVE|nr:hypothetical protein AVEN_134657-1 [Araneus ventricosus]
MVCNTPSGITPSAGAQWLVHQQLHMLEAFLINQQTFHSNATADALQQSPLSELRFRLHIFTDTYSSLSNRLLLEKAVNERIITAELSLREHKVIIIGIYWVNESDIPEIKKNFQDAFKNVLKKWKEHELIILGDFNSKVGTSTISHVVGEFGDKVKSNNCSRLIKICEEFKLKIQNTFFYHEDIRKYTRYEKKSKSLIDFCITRQDTRLYVLDVLACRWLECGTDHIFLEATVSFPVITNDGNRKSICEEIKQLGERIRSRL